MQAGRTLQRPLTLAPSREAAAMDTYTQHLIDSEGLPDDGSSSRAAHDGGEGGSSSGATDQPSSSSGAAGKAAGEVVGLPNQTADRPHQITQVSW